MAYKQLDNINIEGGRIIFRNFSGAESQFNKPGERNFCAIIEDPELAMTLAEDGWNIKVRPPREEGDQPLHYLPIKVEFSNFPPNIILVTSRNKTNLNEETISMLDFAEIKDIDMIIRPYCWETPTDSGVKAYLKTMYVTIEEDQFAYKYD